MSRYRRAPVTSGFLAQTALPKLLSWLSPAFPVGSFAYSHGLEWAVEAREVGDEGTVNEWIGDVLRHGSGRTDAILLRHAYRAGTQAELARVAEVAEAAQPGRERREETLGLGAAFLIAAKV